MRCNLYAIHWCGYLPVMRKKPNFRTWHQHVGWYRRWSWYVLVRETQHTQTNRFRMKWMWPLHFLKLNTTTISVLLFLFPAQIALPGQGIFCIHLGDRRPNFHTQTLQKFMTHTISQFYKCNSKINMLSNYGRNCKNSKKKKKMFEGEK